MTVNRKSYIKIPILLLIVLCAAFITACAGKEPEAPADTPVQTEKEESKPLVTEEDFRDALANESDDKKKLEIYDEFFAGYRLTEDEYKEYAALCEKTGDAVKQREVLYKLYTIDPTEEHGQLLSEMTYSITGKDDDKAASLLENMVEELKNCGDDDFSPDGLKSIIGSDDWKRSFYLDNGTFTSHTGYKDDKISASVASDMLATRAVITEGDVKYLCDISFESESFGHVGLKDGVPEGEYCYRLIENGVDIVLVNGYYKEGHYVNQFEMTVGGIKYKGSFDEKGKTKETQPEGFSGVVYAYTEDGSKYLYAEDTTVDEFVADAKKLGLEGFEE